MKLLTSVAFGFAALAAPAPGLAQDAAEWLETRFGGRSVKSLPTVTTKAIAPIASFLTQEYRVNYGLAQVNAAGAYALGFTGKGVLVAVLDSGIDVRLPEFAGRISPASYNFAPDGRSPFDLSDLDATGHGTHVAGTIAANRDGTVLHGVAYDAQLLVMRAITPAGAPAPAAIAYAAAQGAKVLNGSYGPSFPTILLPNGASNPDYELYPIQPFQAKATQEEVAAIRKGMAADMVMVFAAGNERGDQPTIARHPSGAGFYPAIKPANAGNVTYGLFDGNTVLDSSRTDFSDLQPYLVTVVAVDRDNKIAPFSNLCGLAAAWCISAPGVDIISTVPRGTGPIAGLDYNASSGTSMAAPHVAGAAALVREALPFLTAPQVVQTILTTATSLGDPAIYGWGLLNAGKAVLGPTQFASTFDVDTRGLSGTFGNAISGSGGLIKRGEGQLQIAATNTYAGGTSVLGGTLALNGSVSSAVSVGVGGTLRGTGQVNAALSSAGTVRPGNSPGTITVTGPIALAGTSRLMLDIDGPGIGTGAGNYSRLVGVGASATVAADGRVAPVMRGLSGDATNSFTPALGQSFSVLLAGGGLTGSFSGLDQPVAGLPASTRFDTLYRADSLDLIVTPSSYADLATLGLAQSGNARAVGGALDAARPIAGTRPDEPRREFYDALYQSSAGSLGQGLNSLAGQSHADAMAAHLASRRLVGATIDRRLTSGGGTGQAASALQTTGSGYAAFTSRTAGAPSLASRETVAPSEGRVWGEALYGIGRRAGDAHASGSRFDASGALVGVERDIGHQAMVGIAAGYVRTEGEARGGSFGRFDVDSYSGTIYGRAGIGAFVFRGSVGAAYADSTVRRSLAVGSFARSAHGESTGYDITGNAMAGYRLPVMAGLDLTPEAGIGIDRIRRGGLTETGAGALGLTVSGDTLLAARSLLGARVSSPLGSAGRVRFDLRAYWSHELADNIVLTRATLLGAGLAVRSPGGSRNGAVLGASVSGRITPAIDVSASYDGDIRDRAVAHRFSVSLTGRW